MKTITSTLLAVLLIGCATTQSVPVEERTRLFPEDYNEVFSATVRALTSEGFVVKTIDAETGLIDTDYKYRSGITLKGQQRRKVNVLLQELPDGTKVLLTVAAEEPNEYGEWQSRPFTRKAATSYYENLFDRIETEVSVASP